MHLMLALQADSFLEVVSRAQAELTACGSRAIRSYSHK